MSYNRLFHHLIKTLFVAAILSCSMLVLSLPEDEFQLINIQADNATHDEKKGLTIYNGQVVLEQGSLKVEADTITIYSDKNREIKQLTAVGSPAKYQQKPEIDEDIIYASANTITYKINAGEIIFTGRAQIIQGQTQLKSDNITYLSKQKIFKAQKNKSGDTNQRVEMIIPPKKKLTTEKP